MTTHTPVLLKEVLEGLAIKPNMTVVDGTANGGGHAQEFLKLISPNGTLIAIELDSTMIPMLQKKLSSTSSKVFIKNDNYKNIAKILNECGIREVEAILLDLGFSTTQLSQMRGFSFNENSALDMRFSNENLTTARELLNNESEDEIIRILIEYGEERFAKRIAHNICESRKKKSIDTTSDLVNIIYNSLPYFARKGKIHFATRVFQALRIAVNRELDNLLIFLNLIPQILSQNGRVGIISFHSLEDRIVKRNFQLFEKSGYFIRVNKKPIIAHENEKRENPKSRSAKLRILERLKK